MRILSWVARVVPLVVAAGLVVGVKGAARGDVDTPTGSLAGRFETLRQSFADLTYPQLEERLHLGSKRPARLSFDPTRVAYFERVQKALGLTPEEEEIYRRTGMVSVDHGQRSTMADSYLAIFRSDLPVLVTTDSILHALHRSFDAILVELEVGHIAPTLETILEAAHERLRTEVAALPGGRASDSASDVDLYLTVARDLLIDPQTSEETRAALMRGRVPGPNCDAPANFSLPACQAATAARLSRELKIHTLFGQDPAVRDILKRIATLVPDELPIYGGRRAVDWSQFKPRGHYANTPALRRYFETMMWLGRADLGFHLGEPAAGSASKIDVPRERRDALIVADLLRGAGKLDALGGIEDLLAYLVGASDNATPADVAAALARAGVTGLAPLEDRATFDRVAAQLTSGRRQQIPSQLIEGVEKGGSAAKLPGLFQLFGRRFVLDSFVLSKVVLDAITFRGEPMQRTMPSGLDVMAAWGDDEAVRLLRPELEQYGYAANLLAARTLVKEQPAASWDATTYDVWLDALSKLSRAPGKGAVPEVMRSPEWRRKELQTRLASWAELRHDTILYAKQSYGAGILCKYPAGYVEPYPAFFARVAFLVDELARRLAKASLSAKRLESFLSTFSSRVRQLQRLAEKELAAKPFDAEEKKLLEDTIHVTVSGGCGRPSNVYTGWYPTLFYSGVPDSWEPTIADVHTDVSSGQALDVGVGDVDFLVVAIDNRGDRAAYVGPVYSYYEFPSVDRLTDEQWRDEIRAGKLPARPAWTAAFQPAARLRQMVLPPAKPLAAPASRPSHGERK